MSSEFLLRQIAFCVRCDMSQNEKLKFFVQSVKFHGHQGQNQGQKMGEKWEKNLIISENFYCREESFIAILIDYWFYGMIK